MRIFVAILLTFLISSCRSKTFRFEDSDFEWISYKNADTLIFTSNTGDTDSLFIKDPKRYMLYKVDPLSPFPKDSIEKFYVPYFFSRDTIKRSGQYPGETIVAMTKTTKNRTRIGFGIVTNDAFFHGLRYYDLEELSNSRLTDLETDLKTYHDILVIEPDTSNQELSKRDHYVLRMYWSRSEGLVRFDKNNNVQYTLAKKYGQ